MEVDKRAALFDLLYTENTVQTDSQDQTMKRSTFTQSVVALAAFVLAFAISQPAHAAEINVGCDPDDLISAINTANSIPDFDILNLTADCVYRFATGDERAPDSALPRITTSITVYGNGATIERDAAATLDFRLFYVDATGDLSLDNVTVSGGSVSDGSGGGILSDGGALTVTNSTIADNSAAPNGGGISNTGGRLRVADSLITNNSAHWNGGGINNEGGTLKITGSTLSDNSAGLGGGFFNDSGITTVTNSSISDNSVDLNGGGLYHAGGSTLTITNSTISDNSATGDSSGGGILNYSTLVITNSIISGNSSGSAGGGIFNFGGTLTLSNSTLTGNRATAQGGGIRNYGGTVTVINSILWGNESELDSEDGTVTLTYSIVEGGFEGTSNLDVDPLFVTPEAVTSTPTSDVDYHLQPGSPAIDAGSTADLPADAPDLDGDRDTSETVPYDLDGNPRVVGDGVDIGAYEAE
jgi:hypothetical protein